jgi:hypothetical protein
MKYIYVFIYILFWTTFDEDPDLVWFKSLPFIISEGLVAGGCDMDLQEIAVISCRRKIFLYGIYTGCMVHPASCPVDPGNSTWP